MIYRIIREYIYISYSIGICFGIKQQQKLYLTSSSMVESGVEKKGLILQNLCIYGIIGVCLLPYAVYKRLSH